MGGSSVRAEGRREATPPHNLQSMHVEKRFQKKLARTSAEENE